MKTPKRFLTIIGLGLLLSPGSTTQAQNAHSLKRSARISGPSKHEVWSLKYFRGRRAVVNPSVVFIPNGRFDL